MRVAIYTDIVPGGGKSSAEAKLAGSRNLDLQRETFNDITRPLYVAFRPDKKQALADGKYAGTLIDKRSGQIFDVEDFVKFLESANGPARAVASVPAINPTRVPLTRLPEVARSSPTLVPTMSAAVKAA